MHPDLPTDFALRRDLLRARSFGDMLDVLRANTTEPPSSIKELAELRVQNAKLTRDNQALLRRLESALADSTRFEHDLATVVRERDEWKRHATKTSELVAFFRNTVCVLELQLRESTRQANRRVDSCQKPVDHLRRMVDQRDKDLKRMSKVLAERDVAYSALQWVASSYFEQVQEAAAVISSGGADRASITSAESSSARRTSCGIKAGSQLPTLLSLLPPGSTLPGFPRATCPSTLGGVVSWKRAGLSCLKSSPVKSARSRSESVVPWRRVQLQFACR
ncbi:unnamed protein product [Phytophthora fragariaefolia]|uniref:Unnamed protein product n=1 Tax=Phytophthora fragariaefolia TaxID=1490495 RepID=A0A9W6Y6D1_9STRA|nr:unnamed protein product [Phytophthora fragariaefolia]